MGSPKALLDWHGAPLLVRVALLLHRVAEPVLVVAGAGDELPQLPSEVELVPDRHPGAGPLAAIASGLAALAARAERVYISPVDVPFLHPRFARRLCELLGEDELVVPLVDGRPQPLPCCLAASSAATVADLVAAGERRAGALAGRLRTRRVGRDELLADADLATADPALRSLTDVNNPEALACALQRPLPALELERAGTRRPARAAWLGQLLGEERPEALLLDGQPVAAQPWLPLVDGDLVVIGGKDSAACETNTPAWTSAAPRSSPSSAAS
jgi:molybdopterin-guanine dinucleotide biosynthesis protein A